MIKVLLPPLDAPVHPDGNIALLAHSTAETPRLGPRRHVRQRIRQIIKLAPVKQVGRHVVLEPKHLGHLHLDAHGAADVAQEVVARLVDGLGLGQRAVVQPQDDVAVVAVVGKVRAGHGDGLVGVVREDGEGAGGVEADAADACGVDLGLGDDLADAEADATPDVGGGLFLLGGSGAG